MASRTPVIESPIHGIQLISDPIARAAILTLHNTLQARSGAAGETDQRYVTLAELNDVKRKIPKPEPRPQPQGLQSAHAVPTTPGGGASAFSLSAVFPVKIVPDPFSGGFGVISHEASGVVAGTYGNTTLIPQFTVEADGHVTSVTELAFSAAGGLPFLFGPGLDGAAHLDGVNTYPSWCTLSGGVYTMIRPATLTTLIVDAGITLKPSGYPIYCNVVLENNGTISNDGHDAVAYTLGAAGTSGQWGGGRDGTVGMVPTQGNNGNTPTALAAALGGSGGKGGDTNEAAGPSFSPGGGAGLAVIPAGGVGGLALAYTIPGFQLGYVEGIGSAWARYTGGGGGGSGSQQGTGPSMPGSGAGGGGGGVVPIFALAMSGNGTISARGGKGGDANPWTSGQGASGGGGGGGGGVIVCITSTATWQSIFTVSVAAGLGGIGTDRSIGGSGDVGSPGDAGVIGRIITWIVGGTVSSGGSSGFVDSVSSVDVAIVVSPTIGNVIISAVNFVGDTGAGGVHGMVPAPAAGDAAANKFLSASGAWAVAGTLTSVGLSLPSELTVTVSPITTSGSLTAVWATKAANKVFAGPTTGSAATPAFRSLVAADIPALPFQLEFIIGNGNTLITVAAYPTAVVYCPRAGTITSWTVLSCDAASPTSGSITFDIWKVAYGSYPPSVTNTIIPSGTKPNIAASGTKNTGSNLTGWTTTFAAGDTIFVHVDAITAFKAVKLIISYNG